jgi:2-polyprenyl-3-methyl-5-hydroxy-6-metoxy-1,4-benzoquinol methylase
MPRLLSSLLLSPSPSLSLSSLLPSSRARARARRYAQQAIIPAVLIKTNNNFRQNRERRQLHEHVVPPSQQQQQQQQQQQINLKSKHQQQQHRCMMVSTKAGTTDTTGTTDVTSLHYENHLKEESYEDSYFYESGEYMEHLINLCRVRLQIQEQKPDQEQIRKRCILDIGGGTGNFAKELIQNNDNSRIVVIDPFLIGDNNDSDIDNDIDNSSDVVSFIKAPAEDFLISQSDDDDWRTNIINHKYDGYDQILLKEVIHHFNENDRVGIFRGMKDELRKQSTKSKSTITDSHHPSILIITRPQIDIDYPLWSEAKDVWKQNQPSIQDIQQELIEAGYTNIVWNVESYPCSIKLNRWTEMIRSRFWSTFSNFTDQELDDACNKIAVKAGKDNDDDNDDNDDNDIILRFEDRLIFLTAS